jgi:hypothetical protein
MHPAVSWQQRVVIMSSPHGSQEATAVTLCNCCTQAALLTRLPAFAHCCLLLPPRQPQLPAHLAVVVQHLPAADWGVVADLLSKHAAATREAALQRLTLQHDSSCGSTVQLTSMRLHASQRTVVATGRAFQLLHAGLCHLCGV